MWNAGKARIPLNNLYKLLTEAPLTRSYVAGIFDAMFVAAGAASFSDHTYEVRERTIQRAMDGFLGGDPPVPKILDFLVRNPMEMSVERTRRYVLAILLVLALMTVITDDTEGATKGNS